MINSSNAKEINVELYKNILEEMDKYGNYLIGIADIGYSNYYKDFNSAIIIAVPHREILTLENYLEERLEENIIEAREKIDRMIPALERVLKEKNINYYTPPVAQSNEKELLANFSFKYGAVNAGLGWIGKNGVLITEKYGPRVRLSAILVNCDLPVGKPIIKSLCDEGCFACVDACPHKALKGKQWNINMLREELIDFKLCNEKRSLFIKKYNRKHSCGFCMVACPIGVNSIYPD